MKIPPAVASATDAELAKMRAVLKAVGRAERDAVVSVLTEDELATVTKMSAGPSRQPSSPARPADKHHSRSQMREPDGKFRASFFRRVVNASAHPKLGGRFFA